MRFEVYFDLWPGYNESNGLPWFHDGTPEKPPGQTRYRITIEVDAQPEADIDLGKVEAGEIPDSSIPPVEGIIKV